MMYVWRGRVGAAVRQQHYAARAHIGRRGEKHRRAAVGAIGRPVGRRRARRPSAPRPRLRALAVFCARSVPPAPAAGAAVHEERCESRRRRRRAHGRHKDRAVSAVRGRRARQDDRRARIPLRRSQQRVGEQRATAERGGQVQRVARARFEVDAHADARGAPLRRPPGRRAARTVAPQTSHPQTVGRAPLAESAARTSRTSCVAVAAPARRPRRRRPTARCIRPRAPCARPSPVHAHGSGSTARCSSPPGRAPAQHGRGTAAARLCDDQGPAAPPSPSPPVAASPLASAAWGEGAQHTALGRLRQCASPADGRRVRPGGERQARARTSSRAGRTRPCARGALLAVCMRRGGFELLRVGMQRAREGSPRAVDNEERGFPRAALRLTPVGGVVPGGLPGAPRDRGFVAVRPLLSAVDTAASGAAALTAARPPGGVGSVGNGALRRRPVCATERPARDTAPCSVAGTAASHCRPAAGHSCATRAPGAATACRGSAHDEDARPRWRHAAQLHPDDGSSAADGEVVPRADAGDARRRATSNVRANARLPPSAGARGDQPDVTRNPAPPPAATCAHSGAPCADSRAAGRAPLLGGGGGAARSAPLVIAEARPGARTRRPRGAARRPAARRGGAGRRAHGVAHRQRGPCAERRPPPVPAPAAPRAAGPARGRACAI